MMTSEWCVIYHRCGACLPITGKPLTGSSRLNLRRKMAQVAALHRRIQELRVLIGTI